ncbi:MAG: LamG domain-containing protein, partial [Candidatus Pacebacteria bacterium]|nr:LamG domain-containing protein [Candidatus Paceibacterota bacterium]
IHKIFDGDYVPDVVETEIIYYYGGAEYTIDLDTSTSHLERIWVNLRPISSIDSVNGFGDIQSTVNVEEAVKGADFVLEDSHTIAYWPLDEGGGSQVYATGYQGTIYSGLWRDESRPNSTSSHSIEFDGTFTNIDTDLNLNSDVFTVEAWVNTNSIQTMTIVSDKDNEFTWGYNLYIDGFVKFDFTVNNGAQTFSVNSSSLSSISDGEWHFVAVVRGEDYVQLWIDGEMAEEISWSGEIDHTSSSTRIGQIHTGQFTFKGLIGDLRFSDIARHSEDFLIGSGVVEFVSTSYDMDGEISENIWSSAIDGELGRGSVLYYPVEDLTVATHTIQLSVMDNNGTTSDAETFVLVVMQRPDSQILYLRVNNESTA